MKNYGCWDTAVINRFDTKNNVFYWICLLYWIMHIVDTMNVHDEQYEAYVPDDPDER